MPGAYEGMTVDSFKYVGDLDRVYYRGDLIWQAFTPENRLFGVGTHTMVIPRGAAYYVTGRGADGGAGGGGGGGAGGLSTQAPSGTIASARNASTGGRGGTGRNGADGANGANGRNIGTASGGGRVTFAGNGGGGGGGEAGETPVDATMSANNNVQARARSGRGGNAGRGGNGSRYWHDTRLTDPLGGAGGIATGGIATSRLSGSNASGGGGGARNLYTESFRVPPPAEFDGEAGSAGVRGFAGEEISETRFVNTTGDDLTLTIVVPAKGQGGNGGGGAIGPSVTAQGFTRSAGDGGNGARGADGALDGWMRVRTALV